MSEIKEGGWSRNNEWVKFHDIRSFVQYLYDEFIPGDVPLPCIQAHYTEDCIFVYGGETQDPAIPLCGSYQGHAGIVDFLTKFGQLVEAQKWQVTELLVDGNKAIATLEVCYKVKETGKIAQGKEIHIHTVRDLCSAKVEMYFDYFPLIRAFQK